MVVYFDDFVHFNVCENVRRSWTVLVLWNTTNWTTCGRVIISRKNEIVFYKLKKRVIRDPRSSVGSKLDFIFRISFYKALFFVGLWMFFNSTINKKKINFLCKLNISFNSVFSVGFSGERRSIQTSPFLLTLLLVRKIDISKCFTRFRPIKNIRRPCVCRMRNHVWPRAFLFFCSSSRGRVQHKRYETTTYNNNNNNNRFYKHKHTMATLNRFYSVANRGYCLVNVKARRVLRSFQDHATCPGQA